MVITPKRIPTEDVVSSVEAVLTNEREPPEWTKDNISKRVASSLQSASLTNCSLNKDERQPPKRLKNDKDVCILMTDKLINDKHTYEALNSTPTKT